MQRGDAALRESEGTHDYVLLVGDATPTDWTHHCTRHADEVLMLMPDAGTAMPSGTLRWLARRPVSDHIHLRRGHGPDMARLARVQSRNAVGLVLAGGGARGFAHLGVCRALCEHGIGVDFVGGTRIGAIMAALIATNFSRASEVVLQWGDLPCDGGTFNNSWST